MENYKEQLIELKGEVGDCESMLSLLYEALIKDVDLVYVLQVLKIIYKKLGVIIKIVDGII